MALRARAWALVAVAAISAGACLVLLSGGEQRTYVCRGKVQFVHQPETQTDAGVVTVRLTKWPNYVHLWAKSYGELRLTGEDSMTPYLDLTVMGDLIGLRGALPEDQGVFNVISGRLSAGGSGRIFDVTCQPQQPVVGR